MKKFLSFLIISLSTLALVYAKQPDVAPSYAWEATMPLGVTHPSTIDTLLTNYAQRSVPSAVSSAYATTGNLGAQGINMIWMERKPQSDFYFVDPLRVWLPSLDSYKFYNTRIPMTIVSYNFGGGRDVGQDRLNGVFSGNVNKKIQIGAYLDYLYSRGSYQAQGSKDFNWGFSGSYMGERYQMMASLLSYNMLNKENGGLKDDTVILDPDNAPSAAIGGGPKNFAVNLNDAHTRVKGLDLFVNNRYSLGYHHVERNDTDTIVRRTFIPVTDLIWTFNLKTNSHVFTNKTNREDTDNFWADNYYDTSGSYDKTSYTKVSNTFGVGLIEGFHKWVKMGLTGFVTYDYSRYRLPYYDEADYPRHEALTPLPDYTPMDDKITQNKLYVGARLHSDKGKYFKYDAIGRIGVVGAAGEFNVSGHMTGNIPIRKDTLSVTAYAKLTNEHCSPLMETYRSNHYIWNNKFDNTQSFRFGGQIEFPRWGTAVNVGTETVTNCVYFDRNALPAQHSGGVQLFWARLEQPFAVGPLHWDNRITYQATSNEDVIPLPALAVYSNLYVTFKIAKVLSVQFGVDCDYYTRYRAPGYQPATEAFYNQDAALCGNFAFMNAYINMKLSRARFYVMMSHVNQGMGSNNYFSIPHYPLNPRRFQLGVSVDFAN